MVNTRILEQRLGWRRAAPGEGDPDGAEDEAMPPPQPMRHAALLQGRLRGDRRKVTQAPAQRIAIEDLWDSLPVIAPDVSHLSARRGQAPEYGRGSSVGRAMDQLRTQLLRTCDAEGWRRIGITAAGRGAGRSFVTAALGASCARLDSIRVLVVDADLERPGLHEMLGLPVDASVHDVVTGGAPQDVLRRVGPSMAVALSDRSVAGAADRMHAPDTILAWRAMIDATAPDIVLIDLPPLLNEPLTAALMPQLDAIFLVADGLRDTAADILECEHMLEGHVPLLGVILNKSEDSEPRTRGRNR